MCVEVGVGWGLTGVRGWVENEWGKKARVFGLMGLAQFFTGENIWKCKVRNSSDP